MVELPIRLLVWCRIRLSSVSVLTPWLIRGAVVIHPGRSSDPKHSDGWPRNVAILRLPARNQLLSSRKARRRNDAQYGWQVFNLRPIQFWGVNQGQKKPLRAGVSSLPNHKGITRRGAEESLWWQRRPHLPPEGQPQARDATSQPQAKAP